MLLRFRTNNSDYKSPVRQQEYAYFIKKQKNWKPLCAGRKRYKRNKNLFDKESDFRRRI